MAVASDTCVSAFRIGVCLLLLAAVAAAFISLPVEQMLKDFLTWVKEDLGPWGPVMLVFAYIPLTVLAVPAAVLTLGGGYLFGMPVGFIADSIGATLGATVAFIFGRTIGRSYVISKLRNYSQFQAVAIASERSGFKIVLLLRLVPLLPFNVLNYLLSVTPVRLGEYVLASWLGMMPTTFGMVYVGTTLKDLSNVTYGWDEVSTSQQVIMALGFVTSVILIFCITKVAKGALEIALAESAKQQKIVAPTMLPIVADNSSVDLHKPFVISSSDENERQSLV
ncbi:hypothetical protein like AT1G03260 [Hibiscus trionum]|uniref:VTT domain-containing protein n=1 Tax=Hibiscus trionum TaxID=183268 RepID=A0A9W7HEJ6_HIBTR|nr:hypothetical protein like AT1G03260 [Hibiscus trionum]